MDRDIELFLRYLEERKKFYDRRMCGRYFQIDGKNVPNIKRNEIGMGQAFRLFNYYASNKTSDIDNYNMSISLIRILSVPKEQWPLHGEIFIQFDELSMILEESPLNIRGKLNIILRMLEKNMGSVLARDDEKKVAGIDVQYINQFEFRNMTKDEFLIFIRSDEYGKISSKEESEWNEREKEQMEEFTRYFEQFPLDIQPYVDKHLLVKEHYLDKKDCYTEEDLEIFLQVIKEFGTCDELVLKIKAFLMKDIEKRKKQVKGDVSVVRVSKEKVKPKVSDKQYRLLNK